MLSDRADDIITFILIGLLLAIGIGSLGAWCYFVSLALFAT